MHEKKHIFFDEDRRNLLSHVGSEEKKIFPSTLKNLLCSTQLGSGNSAGLAMVIKTMEPGDTGSGFYSSWQGPITREVLLHHGQRGRPLQLMLQGWLFTKFLLVSSYLLPSP